VGVTTELKTLASYTEFLGQGTSVMTDPQQQRGPFFSAAVSGTELYCHLDCGYAPHRFVMGNVAYALGLGRGLTGGLRTLARGEVKEYSDLYNGIRHLALARLEQEALQSGANAVVDVRTELRPFSPGILELIMTGTASVNPNLGVQPGTIVTSELSGEELWSLAKMGYGPMRLLMATSVYSLGLAAGIGTWFQSFSRGELPELTQLVYQARENCLELIRSEAQRIGAERVIGNRLMIRELSPGLIEVIAIGTAVRRLQSITPATEVLIPQALTASKQSLDLRGGLAGVFTTAGATSSIARRSGGSLMMLRLVVTIAVLLFVIGGAVCGAASSSGHHSGHSTSSP
ncbi:MAG: heavy metal-binding domain-containing protein, partial [Polyangiaceae bacterium]